MPTHSASSARKHLADLLDAAEAGESVLVQRRGQLFKLELVPSQAAESPMEPLFVADSALLDGEWSFDADGSFTLRSS